MKILYKILIYPYQMLWNSIFENDAHTIVSKKGWKNINLITKIKKHNNMKKTLLILLLLFPLLSSAQLCRYCTNDEMLEMFDEHEYKAQTGYTDSGTKYYYIEHGFCTQIYYMYYDVNTVYAIISANENYIKTAIDKLNKEYTKTSTNTWKNDECRVELQFKDGTYAVVFNYK